jgi:hypothetical protein
VLLQSIDLEVAAAGLVPTAPTFECTTWPGSSARRSRLIQTPNLLIHRSARAVSCRTPTSVWAWKRAPRSPIGKRCVAALLSTLLSVHAHDCFLPNSAR